MDTKNNRKRTLWILVRKCSGEDDANVGRKYDLPFVQLVDAKGEMTKETPWAGTFCKKADKPILIDLETRG